MWVRKSDALAKREILIDVLSDSLVEMSLHGKEKYQDWSLFVRGFEDRKLLGEDMITIPDFETQFMRACNRDFDADQF